MTWKRGPPSSMLVRWRPLLAYGGLRIGEALPLRRRHIDLTNGRVVITDAVSELPGGPVIDTPKNHQRRTLLVPAFVAELVGEHLATLPDDPDAFAFPGRQTHTPPTGSRATTASDVVSFKPWPPPGSPTSLRTTYAPPTQAG
ncbi:hypothetical protein [Micromonospora sp. KLBMP9576]|uniref:hypothetical protein n=1 Tax=Micromonospora sp. KLBMP9576 TaxID=3424769 RepID=UPI003D9085F2